jgi:zinc/manganese transport system substrate-binding protein
LKTTYQIALALSLLLLSPAFGALKMVTSTTDLAWAAKEIGGANVEVQALLQGTENPHFIDAIPDYIRLVAEAQVVCIVGLELEVGWMPKVLAKSGNAQVQPGGKGFCETGKGVTILDKPTGGVDRSMGDIHPAGNPHFWLSPTSLGEGSKVIYETLANVDPENVAVYLAGYQKLIKKLETIKQQQSAKIKVALSSAEAPVLIEYHKEFAYLLNVHGLKSLGSIEEKPGVAPSAGRLAEVALSSKKAGIKFVLAAETAPKKTLEKFKELSGLPVIQVPMSVQPSGRAKNYEEFQNLLADSLVEFLKAKPTI